MSSKKRNSYLKYLDKETSEACAKVPRQTIHSSIHEKEIFQNDTITSHASSSGLNEPQLIPSEQAFGDLKEEENIQEKCFPNKENTSFFENPDFSAKLPGCGFTIREFILMFCLLVHSYHLSWRQSGGVLELIRALTGNAFDFNIDEIRSFMRTKGMDFHVPVCPQCFTILPTSTKNQLLGCQTCSWSESKTPLSKKSFFTYFDVYTQVRTFVTENSQAVYNQLQNVSTVIRDISDGKIRKRQHRDAITLTLNTDGAQPFNSSSTAIWPIFLMINELPPLIRRNRLILAGVYYGQGHPNMQMFLLNVVQQLMRIPKLIWNYMGHTVESPILLIACCADSPARADVLNMKHHGGYYACPFCEIQGTMVDGTMRYIEIHADRRTHDNAVAAIEEVSANDHLDSCKGYQGRVALCALPSFDIVNGVMLDYMHAVLEGVQKFLLVQWLTPSAHSYIGSRNVQIAEKRFSVLKPTNKFNRLPRTLKLFGQWKASEFQWFLLFYAIPVMSNLLPSVQLTHFSLLSSAIFILLQKKIDASDLSTAKNKIQQFVLQLKSIYGDEACTLNAHMLIHLVGCVENLGPLWAMSTFIFEEANRKVLRMVTAGKGVRCQIAERYNFYWKLYTTLRDAKLSENAKRVAVTIAEKTAMLHMVPFLESRSDNNEPECSGKCRHILQPTEQQQLLDKCGLNFKEGYHRVKVGHNTFTTSCYTKPEKTDSSCYYSIDDDEYYRIHRIIMIASEIRFIVEKLGIEDTDFHVKKCRLMGNLSFVTKPYDMEPAIFLYAADNDTFVSRILSNEVFDACF